jgi:hypothetical protein
MTGRFSTIAKLIANGLAYSARTAALRDGLPREGDARRYGQVRDDAAAGGLNRRIRK